MQILLTVRAIAATVAPLAITAPVHAYPGTPGCVTLTEYHSVTHGMTQTQVARRFGTSAHRYWGHVTFRWDSEFSKEIDREWRICNSHGKPRASYNGGVEVDFEKESEWDTGQFPAGPLPKTHKSRWSL